MKERKKLLSLSLVCKDFKQRLDVFSQPVPFPRFSDPLTRSRKFLGKLKAKRYEVLLGFDLYQLKIYLYMYLLALQRAKKLD